MSTETGHSGAALSVEFCREKLRHSLARLRDRQVITAAEFAELGRLIESPKTRDMIKANGKIGRASTRTKPRPWGTE